LKLFIGVLLLFSVFMLAGCNGATSSDGTVLRLEDGETRVEVPVVVEVSHAIAAADITFSHSDGLQFLGFVRSEITENASLTPIVQRDNATTLGFFTMENIYEPEGSSLDLGMLVFQYIGSGDQTVTLKEVKLVQVIDSDTTESEIIGTTEFIVSYDNAGDFLLWIIIGVVLLLVIIVVVILIMRSNKKKKELEEAKKKESKDEDADESSDASSDERPYVGKHSR